MNVTTAAAAILASVLAMAIAAPDEASALPELPICQMEDCSDVDGQCGSWIDPDTGNAYINQTHEGWEIDYL